MGNKVVKTLYLDEDDVAEYKHRNINMSMSEVCRIAIRTVLDEGFDDIASMLRVTSIDTELAIVDKDLNSLNRQQDRLIYKRNELTELRNTVMDNVKAVHIANRISELTQILNRYIVDNRFDTQLVRHEYHDLIADIHKLNPNFDIEVHIQRLKLLLDF